MREVTKAAAALGCRRRVRGRMERGSYTAAGRGNLGFRGALLYTSCSDDCTFRFD